jgi:hypothetical protein
MFLLLVIVSSVCRSQDCGSGNVRQARLASLRRSGIAVLKAIEQKDSETLLRYISPGGIGFGPDKPPIMRKDLRRQFAHREGAYCLFFSTGCIANMGGFKGLEPDPILSRWKISYFEWLGLNKTYTIRAGLLDNVVGIEGCAGEFHAQVQTEMKNAPNDIELDFTSYKGRWWLVDTVDSVP